MRKRQRESGIALLISIFILLLISVVAISLIVSSGTESALAGNYRSSTGVYYAAIAGLEEVRARLRSQDPNSFKNTDPGFLPAGGAPLAPCSPVYVINPVGGENITPWDAANPYYDGQFNQEFGGICGGTLPPNPSPTAQSIWNRNPLNGLPFPGPLYKWVRINGVSEQSLRIDVVPYDSTSNDTGPIYYDGAHLNNDPNSGNQVLEVTALAVLPNGSQKLVQYLVAPTPPDLTFSAALTLDGNAPQFTASPSASFWVGGNDQGSVGTCNPGSTPYTPVAVAYTDSSFSVSNFVKPSNPSGIPVGPPSSADLRNHYTPFVSPNPDIVAVTLSPNMQTVAGLNALVQTIQQNADVVVNGNATQSNLPTAMSATNPMTIVINGDLTLSGWRQTGYGLLLVTGKFTYDPDASWDGIILVIGKGWMYAYLGASTTTQIQGAVFLARTLDASGNPLPQSSPPIFTAAPASSGFDFHNTPNSLTNGIYYSSCWIQAATPVLPYRVLSFHEISQ